VTLRAAARNPVAAPTCEDGDRHSAIIRARGHGDGGNVVAHRPCSHGVAGRVRMRICASASASAGSAGSHRPPDPAMPPKAKPLRKGAITRLRGSILAVAASRRFAAIGCEDGSLTLLERASGESLVGVRGSGLRGDQRLRVACSVTPI
jgi:hypothetical protein